MAHSRGTHCWEDIIKRPWLKSACERPPAAALRAAAVPLCEGDNSIILPLEKGESRRAKRSGRGSLTRTFDAKRWEDGSPSPQTRHTRQEEQTTSAVLPK